MFVTIGLLDVLLLLLLASAQKAKTRHQVLRCLVAAMTLKPIYCHLLSASKQHGSSRFVVRRACDFPLAEQQLAAVPARDDGALPGELETLQVAF